MSIAWLSKCWPLQTDSNVCKSVLLVLADHADEDGFCWPRVATICTRAQLGERTVRRAISKLEDDGFLHIEEDYEPAGRQTSNIYRLTINTQSIGAAAAPTPCQSGTHPGAGAAPPTRTVSKNRQENRENVGSSRPRRIVRSDDDTDPAEEAPALGASPKRKSTAERKSATLKSSRQTPFGLALKMSAALKAAGFAAPVNERAVARQMKEWELPVDELQRMVSLFCANPQRYLRGDEVPWIGFVRQREVLRADVKKAAGWTDDDDDPYASEKTG